MRGSIRVVDTRGIRAARGDILLPNGETFIYIGRKFAGWGDSPLHNKFGKWNSTNPISDYYRWLRNAYAKRGPAYRELIRIAQLIEEGAHVHLGCWCKRHGYESCHGDVVVQAVAGILGAQVEDLAPVSVESKQPQLL